MKEFKDKVVVITGAASGIGLGIANRCAQEGMRVVLADINAKSLYRTERKIKKTGAHVIAVTTDVSKASNIEELAQKTLDTFGTIHLLFNNAGVTVPGLTWEHTLADWEWVIGVNLWGVIHGIRIFVPIMLKQNIECHIVNTASIEGVSCGGPGGVIYGVTKHGIVSLSETLRLELKRQNSKIKVSVLCPGLVATNIFTSEINLPSEYQCEPAEKIKFSDRKSEMEFLRQIANASPVISSDKAADIVFQALRNEKFYIFTHTDILMKSMVKSRMGELLKAFD